MKTKTVKLELGRNKDVVVMVYGAPIYEDKKSLAEMLGGVINKGIKVGQKIEAWKFYDTCCSYRLTKSMNNSTFHFQAC